MTKKIPKNTYFSRRSWLTAAAVVGLGTSGCKRKSRCQRCGMVLDIRSRWYTKLQLMDNQFQEFDTPKCAFHVWLDGKVKAKSLWVRGYYSQEMLVDTNLVFAIGSDIFGPMGPDLVPVEPKFSAKFAEEHKAKQLLLTKTVTKAVLENLA
jgi:copper chaperone NosL